MLSTPIPARFPIPFAYAAGPSFIRPIPVASQIGVQAGAASLTDGFPPDCFTPVVAGGVPPWGQDANGLLYQITAWLRWIQAGGQNFYDADFASAIGGYAKNAVLTTRLYSTGTRWISTIDSNVADPDTDGTGWVQDPTQLPIGTPVPFTTSTIPTGFVPANAGTIGDSASNGSVLASDSQAFLLFRQIWLGYPNSQCPLLNSAGVPTARGANPAADFAANRQITLPDFRGRGVTGCDFGGSARLAGVPLISGAINLAGSIFGENLHQLTLDELASHQHLSSLADPGHLHVLTDPGHVHGISDPGHIHVVADPGHIHSISLIAGTQGLSTNGGGEGWASGAFAHISISNSVSINSGFTGISLNPHATGVVVNSATTAISVDSHSTGVSLTNAFAGGSGTHNNVAESVGAIWGLKT